VTEYYVYLAVVAFLVLGLIFPALRSRGDEP
jgi:hypothetical protein